MLSDKSSVRALVRRGAGIALCLASLLVPVLSVQADEVPPATPLWPERAPLGDGETEPIQPDVPRITIHLPPKEKASGTAAIICPGGGYGMRVSGGEGHGIARWLNAHGIAGIVLDYRLPKGRHRVPLLDAQRAIRTVRSQAKELGIHPDQIGIIGFSAGGHLASTAATHFDLGTRDATDPIERVSCRPDFAILVYPVISLGEHTHAGSRQNLLGDAATPELIRHYSNELQVTEQTPPIFLSHAIDDHAVVVENSRLMRDALKAKKIPVHYQELQTGGHGYNGYKGPSWDAWQRDSLRWLQELKLYTPR